ncbi:MAG: ROK family protein [Conexivisphaerales archaeon]
MDGYAIGIDIGATNMRVCSIDSNRRLLWSEKHYLDMSSPPDSFLAQIKKIIMKHKSLSPISVGIAVAGYVSMKSNKVLKMPNAGIGEFDPSVSIEEFLGVKPWIINDAVAAVIPEFLVENGMKEGNISDLVFITLSTGIGGGILLNGRIVAGKEGNAHEVGHIVVDYEGEMECACGGRGHWEAYCSGANLPRFAIKTAGQVKSLRGNNKLDANKIFSLAKKGDKAVAGAVNKAIKINAAGFASVVNEFWPDKLVIGGSLALSQWESYVVPSLEASKKLVSHDIPQYRKSFYGDIVSSYGAAVFSLSPYTFL